MKQLSFLACALLFSVFGDRAGAVHAQDYPTKPVRFVGITPGGSNDVVARMVAQKLSESWGQNVVVDNRPGAGGVVAATIVAKAQPDGYTLLVGNFGANAMAGSLYTKLSYDPAKDFAHVTLLVTFPNVLVVPASSPVVGLKALIEQAKSKPGMLKYGSTGVGGSSHVFVELMNQRMGVTTVHVPYKGGPPALMGLLMAEVDYAMVSVSAALAQLGPGKMRALGVTSANATPRLPDVPPISSVLPGYEALEFHGLHAPAKTPRHIIVKLQQEVAKVLSRPEVKERLDGFAMDIHATTPEEFTAFIRKQVDTWTTVARKANMRMD
jgi:tripartite-type tricarboxylate transporter receptor subunit TctC